MSTWVGTNEERVVVGGGIILLQQSKTLGFVYAEQRQPRLEIDIHLKEMYNSCYVTVWFVGGNGNRI